jgi:carboxypeptidase family protein
MRLIHRVALGVLYVLVATAAHAQVQTGSITGTVTDSSSAVLPGTTVTVTGDRLIGGAATQVTDGSGAYRVDRLPPGTYTVKFELPGFRTMTRDDIRISAGFVATVNGKSASVVSPTGPRRRWKLPDAHQRCASRVRSSETRTTRGDAAPCPP